MIVIQTQDFDINEHYQALRGQSEQTGAVVLFTGLVREFSQQQNLVAMELEHYPGMTEKVLGDIVEQAQARWPLLGVRLVHRVGRLAPGDQIVMVAVSSKHRMAAFEACAFLMDFLKTQATFWKKEITQTGTETWVAAKDSDKAASLKWQAPEA